MFGRADKKFYTHGRYVEDTKYARAFIRKKLNMVLFVFIRRYIVHIFLLLFFSIPCVHAEENSFSWETDLFTDDPFLSEFLNTVGLEQLTRRMLTPEEVLTILVAINIPQLLQQNFYLRTNVLARRSLLDQPLFDPAFCQKGGPYNWGVDIFLNKMAHAYYTKKSTDIDSYLALSSPSLINALNSTIESIKTLQPDFNFDIETILGLFQGTKVEERQAGGMFFFTASIKKQMVRILMPLYYLERNFFLPEEEQKAVEDEFGATTPEEQEQFRKNHLIADKLGIGDTRVEWDVPVIKNPFTWVRAGVMFTLPTAFAWAKGLKGSTYPKPSTFPPLNLTEFVDLISDADPSPEKQEELFDDLTTFSLGAVDRLSANLLDIPLGNGGHIGIGPVVRTHIDLKRYVRMPLMYEGRYSLEYLLPKLNKRAYITRVATQAFEEIDFFDVNSEQEAQVLVDFLQEQFLGRLFLRFFDVRVQPGIIFRWLGKLCYQGRLWDFFLGSDVWLQAPESLGPIHTLSIIKDQLAREKVHSFLMYQSKLFAGFERRFKNPRYTWYINGGIDGSISNYGIGADFTIMLSVRFQF